MIERSWRAGSRLQGGRIAQGWLLLVAALALLLVVAATLLVREVRTSSLQSRYLAAWARELRFELQPGSSPANIYPRAGPFDERMGYTRIPDWVEHLSRNGFVVEAQARQSEPLVRYLQRDFFPPYHEKSQAGLRVLDCRRASLYDTVFPRRAWRSFEDIPPLLVNTLAFIENREILTATDPRHNPALEIPRLGRAMMDQAIKVANPAHVGAGGSTLATQMEKFRHSPQGRTGTPIDKWRQVVSASVRAYVDGEQTGAARQRIVLDYLNGLPLGAQRAHGEVVGMQDGLAVWYGEDVGQVNQLLRADATDPQAVRLQAHAYRQALSLLVAQRRPAFFLGMGQDRLGEMVDGYLRVLADNGVIGQPLRDAALAARLTVRAGPSQLDEAMHMGDRKASTLMRVELAALLQTPRLYDLDRFDIGASSSIDIALQRAVTDSLRRLRDPEAARAAGLSGPQLLERGDPAHLLYSFTLYERGTGVNRLRVQTDNLDQPFDLNSGGKLELGSTAKLRTLVTYLEIIASLHARLGALSPDELARLQVSRRDPLARWAVDYLSTAKDKSLSAMLQAAMQRRYSASPAETFFTGGGAHRFENFHSSDDGKLLGVEDAFRDSVNLVFIRLMRDIVHHYMYGDDGRAERILDGSDAAGRAALLARFADQEGSEFMAGFYARHKGQPPAKSLDLLVSNTRPTPLRLAVIFRSFTPDASFDRFREFMSRHPVAAGLGEAELRSLYERHAQDRYSLSDRGYLAHVHPLELWTAAYLATHPDATLRQVLAASRDERQEAYRWLFRTRSGHGQNARILSMLERDAFTEILRGWKRVGFPFDSLVPSYATAIGSSGDRPAALAELVGILLNDGVRLPSVQVEGLHLAAGTPYETVLAHKPTAGQRVHPREVAAAVRHAMTRVVSEGTAKRLDGELRGPDGAALVVGGKTGTGDNRLDSHGAKGQLIASRVVSRTATFVFFLGDRFFGTITAYVPGPAAQDYKFTSALPVQILKSLAPQLQPVIDQADAGCAPAPRVPEGGGIVMTKGVGSVGGR